VTAVALLDADGRATGRAALSPELAAQEIKPHLIHETVVAEMGWRRAGTHATKTRAQVRGGGRKPWRQKGTGRARQGSIRAPQWTGGGVVFGPTPRSHGGKVNKKVRAQAFRSALRAHVERETVAVMEPLDWDVPSTRRAAAYLENVPDAIEARPLLVVVEDLDGAVARSFRNLVEVYVLDAWDLETVDVMSGRSLLVERGAWEEIAGVLGETEAVEAPPKAPKPKKAKPAPPPPAEEAEEAAPEAEVAEEAPAKPKRTRAKKAAEPSEEPEAEVAEDGEEAPEKPKRTRAKKAAEPSEEPEADAAEEEPQAEAADEADAPEAEGLAEEAEAEDEAVEELTEDQAEDVGADAEGDEQPEETA
jgi:large subunit ribosomal protein L4